MPSYLPTMPLSIRIYTRLNNAGDLSLRSTTAGALYCAKPYSLRSFDNGTFQDLAWLRFFYFPARTDVRGALSNYWGDYLELEDRLGWLYNVRDVDDRWRGTANEYRLAVAVRVYNWTWPLP